MSQITLAEGAAAATPASGKVTIYAKTDGLLYSKDDAGTETALGVSGGGVSDGDKGDVTVSASGTVWTVDNDAISNAKLANMATATIKGRTTAGTGDPEDLTATQATALLNAMVGDSGSGGTKGLVPAPAAGDAAAGKFLKADGTWAVASGSGSVATDSIWDAKGDLAVGTGANTASKLTAGTNGYVLTADSAEATGLKWAAVSATVADGDKGDITVSSSGTAWTVDNGVISNAKLADVATATIKGRATAGTGAPEDLTATQATALLNAMVGDSGSGGTKGLVPAPASGDAAAGKFLKADGTWATPSGSGDAIQADIQTQDYTRFTSGGTADAMTGTLSPAVASYAAGLRVTTTPVGANTVTGPTLNLNGLGAKTIKKRDSSGTKVALAAGDYNASGPFDFQYDGTDFILMNPDAGNGLLVKTANVGLGYGVGAGGTVTQSTSKSTAVTLNKPSGTITMHNAALSAGAYVEFQLINSSIGPNDTVSVSFSASGFAPSNYDAPTASVYSGGAYITLRNRSGSSQSEAVVIKFNVVKGVTS